MKKNRNISLAVCVPLSWSNVPRDFFVSYTSLFTPSAQEKMKSAGVSKMWHLIDESFPLDLSRNRQIHAALGLGASHILFLDADMVFPQDMIVRLLTSAFDITGALYFRKKTPFSPVPGVFDIERDYQKMSPIALPRKAGYVSCDALGMGATLIKRRIFETMREPWFAYDAYGPTGEHTITEDVPFCRKAKQHGFAIVCDTRIVCGHIGREIIGPSRWQAQLAAAK